MIVFQDALRNTLTRFTAVLIEAFEKYWSVYFSRLGNPLDNFRYFPQKVHNFLLMSQSYQLILIASITGSCEVFEELIK